MSVQTAVKKPIVLRIVFILNALKAIAAFIFYYKFTSDPSTNPGIPIDYILFTAIAYSSSFIILMMSIIKKKIWVLRTVLVVDIVASIPATAIIGMVVAPLSIALTFSKPIKYYFEN